MKNLKVYLAVFFTGILTAIAVFLKFSSPESDSELLQMENEATGLETDVAGLEAELDGLTADELTDDQSADFWEGLE